MQSPHEAMEQMADRMGWVGQILGEDFWDQIRETCRAAAPRPDGRLRPGGASARPAGPGAGAGPQPPVDVYVTPAEVVVSAAWPGLPGPEHMAVSRISPSEILLEGYITPTSSQGVVVQRERPVGYGWRTLTLPVPVASGAAGATYAMGIWEVRLPRGHQGGAGGDVSLLQVGSG